jgi:hypothetical protein
VCVVTIDISSHGRRKRVLVAPLRDPIIPPFRLEPLPAQAQVGGWTSGLSHGFLVFEVAGVRPSGGDCQGLGPASVVGLLPFGRPPPLRYQSGQTCDDCRPGLPSSCVEGRGWLALVLPAGWSFLVRPPRVVHRQLLTSRRLGYPVECEAIELTPRRRDTNPGACGAIRVQHLISNIFLEVCLGLFSFEVFSVVGLGLQASEVERVLADPTAYVRVGL